VLERGTPPDAVYAFKHALVRDVAHGSLLRNARQQLHAQIAKALEAQLPELMETGPSYSRSTMPKPGSSSNPSPIGARRAEAPPTARRWQKRPLSTKSGGTSWHRCRKLRNVSGRSSNFTALWVRCGKSLGELAAETGRAYARARELWERLGSPAEFLGVSFGQSRYT